MSADTEAMIDQWFRSDGFIAALSHYIAERRAANLRQRERWDREAAEIRALNAALPEWVDPEATAYFKTMTKAEADDRVHWDDWQKKWRCPSNRVRTSTRSRIPVSDLLQRLERVRSTGPGQYTARCPAHRDRSPSLSIRSGPERTLLFCHAGCDTRAVLDALGLRFADLVESS